MINTLWGCMLLFSIIMAVITGRIEAVSNAAMDSAKDAIALSITLLGIVGLWNGFMNIARGAGLIDALAKRTYIISKLLFPDIPKNSPAIGAVMLNLAANFLGLGNAATPFGLSAMKKLQELNKSKQRASNAQCMFVVLNSASLQLIPTTVIAMRAAAGSHASAEIIVPVWIVSAVALCFGIGAVFVFQNKQ